MLTWGRRWLKMLEIRDLHVYYNHIHALKGINLKVKNGQIVTIIGANGAGKSTTLKALSGLIHSSAGQILFDGQEGTKCSASWWVKNGVVHCPEGRQVFPRMSVFENLEMGAFLRRDININKDLQYVYSLFPILKKRQNQQAITLSGGEQQMLAIGRALMSNPRLLMLDEPSLGLAPMLVKKMFEVIQEIRDSGKTILLVEQNAKMALKVADFGYVLETGKIVFEGESEQLLASNIIQKSYLGEKKSNN